MDKTAIQTKPSAPVTPMAVVEQLIISHPASPIYRALRDLASLRLTVVLFVLSMFLVFFGTLAQTDSGIWTVVNQYFRSAYVWVPFQIFVRFLQVFNPLPTTILSFDDLKFTRTFLFPGGWLIGSLLLANLLAAHAVRFRFTWKRAGILILHAGIIVMMLGELITGLYAVEGNLTIEEGRSANFVEHHTINELAIIDRSDAKIDDVVVIPEKMLRHGGTIQNELLPFDIEVVRYMVNSGEPTQASAGATNPATAGDGLGFVAVERPEVSGADPDQKVDLASAYLNFKDKKTGESLGTYLVSLWFSVLSDRPQHVTCNGKTYDVYLRFKRTYKPYTIQLLDFKHEVYPGTNTPKDFSSFVRFTDEAQSEDREVRIWMNHPLRYGGETFYQSGFLPGDKGTILQVVRNPGWLLPYFSCALVAFGMLVHFGMKLTEFLRSSARRNAEIPVQSRGSRGLARYAPWGVALAAAGLLLMIAAPPKDRPEEMHLNEFSRLPVINDGRVKPWDTLARTCLMKISGRQSFTDDKDRSQPAIKWLLDVVSQKPEALKYKVFRIENEDVLGLLDLKPRSGFRYAAEEFASKMDKVEQEATRAQKIEEKSRVLYDVKILELANKVQLYIELAQLRIPHDIPPGEVGAEWTTYAKIEGEAQALAWARIQEVAREKKLDLDKLKAEQLRAVLHELARRLQGEMSPAAGALSDIFAAYAKSEPAAFNKAVSDYEGYLRYVPTADVERARFEVFFNDFEPFYVCTVLYCLIFVLSCVSFALAGVSFDSLSRPLNWTAFGLAVVTLTVHSGALLARMYLMDRPLVFVTNLYSSAIFIGWGCVVLGLIIELIFRVGIGNLIGSALGFLTVLIAHQLHLWSGSDTLEMMQAVLDTNFWLATHVTCVTLGYTATFVAGALATKFILLGVLTPTLNERRLKILSQMIYGVLCYATLMSFVGTVLGGIWADQSWGRFWGWDPKENGALLIVIWNALILHARWSGLIRPRGMAVLAIVGNMVTAWSWFGTNQLGVGLHAYGFNNKLALGLTIFWISQLAVIALGTLPTKYWWSYNTPKGLAPQT